MTYLIHEVMQCRRGKAPEVLECLKAVNDFLTGAGLIKNGKIYADFSDRMDTLIFDHETDSLDKYFEAERGAYVSPSAEFQGLVDAMNSNTVNGYRQIFEVLV